MTKQVRDWQEDMEMDSPIGYSPPESMEHPIIAMLKQQYEAEKERADKAEAREKKLREAIEDRIRGCITIADYNHADALEKLLASLYPEEEEAK